MNLLSDILTYIRRLIKTASNQQITDALLIDYVNRFYTYDMPARIQLFDLKTTWQLVTQPLVDRYVVPYDYNGVPQFQMLQNPVYCNGVNLAMMTQRQTFFNAYPNFQTTFNAAQGNGTATSFTFTIADNPMLRGIIDMIGLLDITNANPPSGPANPVPFPSLQPGVWITALDTNNNQMVVVDSPYNAETLNGTATIPPVVPANANSRFLVSYTQPSGVFPPINGTYTDAGTINYKTGAIIVNFSSSVLSSGNVLVTFTPFTPGTPRIILFYNNIVTLRPVPDISYVIEFQAYLTPASFLSSNTTQSVPFGYMTEYIARGAARKVLADVGDVEQLQLYEPFFKEQECLVLRRNDRQRSVERTSTIFTDINQQQPWNANTGYGV